MSRKLLKTTSAASELYPVVQDLTKIEYGTGICCGAMLGSFSLAELALPNIHARALSSPDSAFDPSKNKQHRRALSLLQLSSSVAGNTVLNHKRCSSSPMTVGSCGTFETSHTQSVDGDRIDGYPEMHLFNDAFVLTRQIYRCNISTVWECVHREQGTRHCVKMIDKRRFTCKSDKESTLREIAMLTSLQTYQSTYLPRIVLITEDDHQYYLVMDYVEGGNLSAFRQAKHHLPEDHARALARSILSGIADIHRLSVAHFNISPDNILLEPNLCDIVLCDFGYAWDLRHSHLGAHAVNRGGDASQIHGIGRIDHGRLASPRCGSLQYAAPEVIGCDKEFGLAVDMWSVGVILFQLLCGRLPFEDLSKRALKEKIAIGKYEFSGTEWNDVSRGAKQFISTLLHPDPQVRMTVGEALAHPWMTQPLCHDDWLIDDSPKSLRRHKNGRHRPSLVHRLWSRLRSSSSLEGPVSSPLSTPPHLKSNTYSQFVDLSKASTLSMDTMTQVSASPLQISSKSLSWESSFPKPLDDHRRTRSWAEF